MKLENSRKKSGVTTNMDFPLYKFGLIESLINQYLAQISMTSNVSLPKLPEDEIMHVSAQGMEHILKNFDPNVPARNFLWTTDYRVELPVRVKKTGKGCEDPVTYSQMWKQILDQFSNHGALTFEKKPNQWVTLTYKQYYDLACNFAKALIALGINNYTAVNIIGFNSVEWAVAFSGAIFGHYLPIGIYTTNAPEACQYIANHSECQIVILEDRTQLKKYIKILDKIPRVRYFVIWKDSIPEDIPAQIKSKVLTWDQLIEIGMTKYDPKKEEDKLQYRVNEQKPGNCCTFIYTSGTTGPPKAVMISHDNYTWVANATIKRFNFDKPQTIGKGRILSLLPLSHVAAQVTDLVIAAKMGYNVFFADPSALQGNLVRFLQVCRPTIFSTVPRLWEKIEQKITALGAQTTGMKRKIADWAKSKSPQGTYAEINGGQVPPFWGLAKKLVFNKIKQNLGLDKCEIMVFSAAPMRQSTRLFFVNLNIFLYNCFGMSELSGPETYTNPKKWKNFTEKEFLREAGRGLDGLTISIDNPDAEGNGQICLRGRNTFMGYFKDEEETKKTIDNRGFVHSGDVGKVDSDGNLTITGRIKELIITAGGQNVAPVPIENQINTVLPIFSQVVVIGDKRKYLTALVCMKFKSPGVLADEVVDYISSRGSKSKTIQQAIACPALKKIIQQGIEVANTKAISRAQKVINFTILPVEFSIDGGQYTPTMKLKRKIINDKYKAQIEALYVEAKL